MKRKNQMFTSWQISIATASLVLGFMLSLQIKSQAQQKATSLPSRRIEEVTNLLKESEEKRAQLEKLIQDLRNEVGLLKEKSQTSTKKIEQGDELQNKLILTGFAPVKGNGIVIKLDDSKQPTEKGENPANAILHNEDLLKITNELYASGAEAISINDNRLISNSEISCAGPTILINKNRVTPPFEIRAIGSQENMISALEMRGGVIEYLKFFGIQVSIEKKEEIYIPPYAGSLDFKYAKPDIKE